MNKNPVTRLRPASQSSAERPLSPQLQKDRARGFHVERVLSGWGLFVLFCASTAAHAALTEVQDVRYQTWVHELRCLVCQNQTIAESNAPLAADLREQVRSQIESGRSDEEIRRYLTDRYGDFVLYNPPLKPQTWLLWFAPFALLTLALGIALRWFLRPASKPEETK